MATGTGLDSRCHLMEIPPELRLRVYDYIYDQRQTCLFDVGSTGHMYLKLSPGPIAALTSTCHAIRTEVLPILYGVSRFHLHIYDNSDMPLEAHLQIVAGQLRTCVFLKHVCLLHIKVDMNVSREEKRYDLAQQLRELVELAGTASNGRLAVEEIEICAPTEALGNAVVKALSRCRSACEIKVYVDQRMVAKELLEEFLKQVRGRLMPWSGEE
ncbi:hypothetical protein LTS10_001164 [Elasticomyces elasticus]|nr:hypothetical protein LTS10_001164 [Elasticomyces elasticus]